MHKKVREMSETIHAQQTKVPLRTLQPEGLLYGRPQFVPGTWRYLQASLPSFSLLLFFFFSFFFFPFFFRLATGI